MLASMRLSILMALQALVFGLLHSSASLDDTENKVDHIYLIRLLLVPTSDFSCNSNQGLFASGLYDETLTLQYIDYNHTERTCHLCNQQTHAFVVFVY